jgi:hypothetical protein
MAIGVRVRTTGAPLEHPATDEKRRSTVPKFLIEVPHSPDELACARVIQVFLSTGSHFLTNAEWGCGDGVHSAWMMVDVGSRTEAIGILPPAFRAEARIVGLNRFSMADLEPIFRRHAAAGGAGAASSG